MKSRIGTLALRFAATVVLFAPVAAAQAHSVDRSICRDVWDWGSDVCDSVYYPPAPAPAPQPLPPSVEHTTGSETAVQYDSRCEARKGGLAGQVATSGRANRGCW
jgi:hypothetical protein